MDRRSQVEVPAMRASRLRRRVAQRLADLQQAGLTHISRRRHPTIGGAVQREVATVAQVMQPLESPRAPVPVSPMVAAITHSGTLAPVSPSAIRDPQPGIAAAQAPGLFDQQDSLRSAESVLSGPERATALKVLADEVAACRRCPHLAETRTQTVFGVGNPQARLVFFGEAPGADEDRQGEPFVGRAGQLLNKIIEACRMQREDVYIMNVLKCRPPDNRTPLPEEVANCRGHFERQLEILRPEFICCLGLAAAQALLGTSQSMARLRGKFFDYRGATVMCTYHPAYLLRNPAAKRDVWEDMKLLMRKMGVEL
jgi:uracil-DNA glycosylase family 4